MAMALTVGWRLQGDASTSDTRWCPPSDVCWFKNRTIVTIDISTIKHSEIGVICTNLAIPNWGTTL